MRIIGLTGPKGCGKSTFARILEKKYGFEILSFASPIKRMLIAMGIPEHCINDPVMKELPLHDLKVTPRFLMQTLGTEWMRKTVDDQGWVRVAESRIRAGGQKDWVIDDVRFVNECDMIHSHSGMVVRFNQDQKIEDSHISEAGLPDNQVEHEIYGFRDAPLPDEFVANFMETQYDGTFNYT